MGKGEKMGIADAQCKSYLSDPERFADAFNYFVYGGRKVVLPGELARTDPTELAFPGGDGRVAVQKYRDLLDLWVAMRDGRAVYAVLGIESQSYVSYAMPVRCMLYDAAQYDGRLAKTRKAHAAEGYEGLGRNERLTGFARRDRLVPVVTLVLYFGPSEWDAPTSLREMLGVHDAELLSLAQDYRINLVAPAGMAVGDFDKFGTGLGLVLKYCKFSKSKDELGKIVKEDKRFRSLDEESARLINVVTNSGLKLEAKEGEVNMCEAIDEMRRDAREEGVQRGKLMTLLGLVDGNVITIDQAASSANMSVADMRAELDALRAVGTS